jgi:hypothetical protein
VRQKRDISALWAATLQDTDTAPSVKRAFHAAFSIPRSLTSYNNCVSDPHCHPMIATHAQRQQATFVSTFLGCPHKGHSRPSPLSAHVNAMCPSPALTQVWGAGVLFLAANTLVLVELLFLLGPRAGGPGRQAEESGGSCSCSCSFLACSLRASSRQL